MDINNSTLDAVWCKDSETSEEYLLDRKTGAILAKRSTDGTIINPETYRADV